ncbi:hypothetical protein [Methylobacterium durans]|uniref:Uncharacterized protein n=1 Tax=Methylobacterium durans TaxID=2202825 RepID=A0A2U8W529_9HYPH|nr:hypothetical protein [Methylobacterium durans]AWN40731.1 hypothetical protein DK389_09590 [Methylobacterium durans]
MLKSPSLLIFVAAMASAPSAQALDLDEMRVRTASFATDYLRIWSSGNTAPITRVPDMYARTVTFYGRRYTQDQLIAEKRRAIQRWPSRRYVHRPGTMQVTCNLPAQRCVTRSTIDFEVSSYPRHAAKRGSARFDLGISFADRGPRIVHEGGGSSNTRRSGRGA